MSKRLCRRALLAVVSVIAAAVARGAPPPVTPEQLQVLKQMPPAQRELLRKSLLDELDSGSKRTGEDTLEDEDDTDGNAIPDKQKPATPENVVRLQPGDTLLINFRPIVEKA